MRYYEHISRNFHGTALDFNNLIAWVLCHGNDVLIEGVFYDSLDIYQFKISRVVSTEIGQDE